ncbi:MAG TPA: UbiD family decarboxylase [Chloroflexota bacterium]|nr:UbiD family decarboxylase [Chloroflexota bacterium]HZU07237.1 UbiD family decarboxylase [Chloroflexota bacterium]
MPYDDFRAFLAALAAAGALLELDRPLTAAGGAALARLASLRSAARPALLLRVEGREGRLVTGAYATRGSSALALGLPWTTAPRQVFSTYVERWDSALVEPAVVAPSAAPCKQVVRRGAAADLTRFPLSLGSGEPHCPGGLLVSLDPTSGQPCLVLGRLAVVDASTVAFFPVEGRIKPPVAHEGEPALHPAVQALARACQAGAQPDAALVLGAEPAVLLAAAVALPTPHDPYALASTLRASPVAISTCEGSDLEIPAYAELVIEGRLLPPSSPPRSGTQPLREPRGEPAVQAGRVIPGPAPLRLTVHTVTHRRDPIATAFLLEPGIDELEALLRLPRSVALYRALKPAFPSLQAVAVLEPEGVVAASLPSLQEHDARHLLDACQRAQATLRLLLLVDADVDPFDSSEVLQALSRSAQAGGLRVLTTADDQCVELDSTRRA